MMKGDVNARSSKYLHTLKMVPELYDAAVSSLAAAPADTVGQVNSLVLSPVLHGYVMWILNAALHDGVQRLYFLARDGYLPCRIARRICEKLELPVECRYFYCSRASLRTPMYHSDLADALDHICRGGMDVTPARLFLRAGIADREARALYSTLELPYAWDEEIPYAQLQEVKQVFARSDAFLRAVSRNSKAEFPALEGYFRQEGILEPGCFAVVDSGWTGTMQRSIQQICRECSGQAALRGYYFGLYHLPEDCDPAQYSSFLFGPGWGLVKKALFNNNLFEVVYSAPHGTTLGYQQGVSGMEPVLAPPNEKIAAYIHTFEKQLDRFTDALLDTLTLRMLSDLPQKRLQKAAAELLGRFMWAPAPDEAERFGSLPFSDDLRDAGIQELAANLGQAELRQNHVLPRALALLGLRRGTPRQSAWLEGSAVRLDGAGIWHRCNFFIYKILLHIRKR